MNRTEALELVAAAIGRRRLIWLGIIGEDASALTAIPQFGFAYSVQSPLRSPGVEAFAVESLTGTRQRDYDISLFLEDYGKPLIESFQRAVSEPSLLMTNAPLLYLPFILNEAPAQYLGPAYAVFKAVSDKAVVEAALQGAEEFTTIPWRTLQPDGERMAVLRDALRSGPIALRNSRQDGGAGHEVVGDEERLQTSANAALDEPIAVAPFLSQHVPVCIGGCVFQDGEVSVHTPSFQLIGITGCSEWDLGYCGNDFGAITRLSRSALDGLEGCTRTAGRWLHSQGFVGVFGVDALVRDDEVVFVEINPRFLGSSRMSAQIDAEMDQPDVFLAHIMACLGLPSYQSMPLAEQARSQVAQSQLLCRNVLPETRARQSVDLPLPDGFSTQLLADAGLQVAPHSLLFALTSAGSVTEDGMSLTPAASAARDLALSAFQPVP